MKRRSLQGGVHQVGVAEVIRDPGLRLLRHLAVEVISPAAHFT